MSVFTGKKIYVSPLVDNAEELRSLLSSNGALLIEGEIKDDNSILYVVDSFDRANVSRLSFVAALSNKTTLAQIDKFNMAYLFRFYLLSFAQKACVALFVCLVSDTY